MVEEQKNSSERRGRRSTEPERLQHSGTAVNELKLKEQQLQERERAIKEREQQLERMKFHSGSGEVNQTGLKAYEGVVHIVDAACQIFKTTTFSFVFN